MACLTLAIKGEQLVASPAHCILWAILDGLVMIEETKYHIWVHIGTRRFAAMAKNTSITLGNHFDEFIAEKVKAGRYGSASEGGQSWPQAA